MSSPPSEYSEARLRCTREHALAAKHFVAVALKWININESRLHDADVNFKAMIAEHVLEIVHIY